MLTPQEVQDKRFVKAVFGGYDMATVDEFLEQLTEDYTALFKENTVLKNKLKVLVDTVEEYRTVDESMRRALLGAQKIAHDMVEEAKQKSAQMIDSANKSANTRKAEIDNELLAERRRLEAARLQTGKFIEVMRTQFLKQAELLESLPKLDVPDPDAKDAQIDMDTREIESSLLAGAESGRDEDIEETRTFDAGPKDDAPEMSEPPESGESPESEGDLAEFVAAEEEPPEVEAEPPEAVEEAAQDAEDRNSIFIEMDDALFEIKLPPTLKELPDEALIGEDTGEVEQPIDLDGLQFGENYKVGK